MVWCLCAGEAARLQAVAQVQQYLATLGGLLEAAAQLQARADSLLPRSGEPAGHDDAVQDCAFEDAAEEVAGPSGVLVLPESEERAALDGGQVQQDDREWTEMPGPSGGSAYHLVHSMHFEPFCRALLVLVHL